MSLKEKRAAKKNLEGMSPTLSRALVDARNRQTALEKSCDIYGIPRKEGATVFELESLIRKAGKNPDLFAVDATLISRSLAEVEAKPISWLWRDRIPFGMFSMLDGDPSEGKSLLTIDVAARASAGRPMPLATNTEFDPVSVLFIVAEDAIEQIVKPRAAVAQADLSLVRVSETIRVGEHERPIRLPDDFVQLEREIVTHRAALLIVDPLLGFLSQAVDSHKDQSIRDVLHQFKLLAERTGAAIVGLRHLGKAGSGNALYRGLGSIAITAAARSAMAVGVHPTEERTRVLATTKCNLGPVPRSITYRIESVDGQPRIAWGDECDITAADLGIREAKERSSKSEEAVVFLREALARGPRLASELRGEAKSAKISERTLDRAKDQLRVVSEKGGFAGGGWTWKLPSAEGRQVEKNAEGRQEIPD